MSSNPRRSMMLHLIVSVVSLSIAGAMYGCGSSGRSAGPGTGGGTSAGTNGFTRGAITAFGSIHLGGGADDKVFDTSTARLKHLDDGIEHDGLDDANVVFRKGMKVEVFHHSDSLRATEVRYMNDLEGPITAKPGAKGATFDVLGAPVLVDANTNFDDSFQSTGLTLGGLAVGNVVEVSGDFDADGVLHASYLEPTHVSAAGRTFEIKGRVRNLTGNAPDQTFEVNGVTFVTNSVTEKRDLAAGLQNDLFVEVKTTSTAAPFVVTRVEGLFGDFDSPENEVRGADKASVEGFIKDLTGGSPDFVFFIGGTRVTTNASTVGVNLVAPNAHVEAEGPVQADGSIRAIKIGAR